MIWWHTIEMPDGAIVHGQQDYRGEAGRRYLLPDNLWGQTVIDFGTYDGFWAIEAKKRGASEVVAVDRWPIMLDTARIALGAYGIPYVCSGDLDFPTPVIGQFDIVLFYGIIYHLRNPYMGLWNAFQHCKPGGLVIVESAVEQGKMEGLSDTVPLLWLVDELHHGDASNYVMPNQAGLLQLCRMAGLVPLHDFVHDYRMTVLCRREI